MFGAKRGVWWRKAVFGGVKGYLGYIFFSTKVPWGTKQVPRVPESPVCQIQLDALSYGSCPIFEKV